MSEAKERREQARLRLLADLHTFEAAKLRVAAAAIGAAGTMRRFGAAFQESCNVELMQHPDMAELDVQLDGFYEAR